VNSSTENPFSKKIDDLTDESVVRDSIDSLPQQDGGNENSRGTST
jgi:hypothetical protein